MSPHSPTPTPVVSPTPPCPAPPWDGVVVEYNDPLPHVDSPTPPVLPDLFCPFLIFSTTAVHSLRMRSTSHRRLARVERHLLPLSPSPVFLSSSPTLGSPSSSTSTSPSISSLLSSLPPHIVLSPAVRSALLSNSPVVALESTIISHGMPHPQNVETALSVEAAAVALHCTPATIAILEGRIHVGLTRPQLERLGQLGLQCRKVTVSSTHSHSHPPDTPTDEFLHSLSLVSPLCPDPLQCSTRDLPVIVAEKGNGSTTVAATMFIASLCGIRVFATGGVGGVHRDVQETGDVR